jgi:hypothetical protein
MNTDALIQAREITDKITRLLDDHFSVDENDLKGLIAMAAAATYTRHAGLDEDQAILIFRQVMATCAAASTMTPDEPPPTPDPLADYDRLTINRASEVTAFIDQQGGNSAFKACVAMVAAVRYCRRLKGNDAAARMLNTATETLDRQKPKKKR